jgi:DHA3 family macrolide efflux protein-like MFS transporter
MIGEGMPTKPQYRQGHANSSAQQHTQSGGLRFLLLPETNQYFYSGADDMKTKNWKRAYFTILGGQAVSLITSGALQMALIFTISAKTESALMLSLASLAGFLPYALLGPFIGVLVDRHSRKAVMILADMAIALAGGVLAITALFTQLEIWMIMAALFARSVGAAFHSPALNAATPLIVPADMLVKYGGYSQSLQSMSYIVSPALGAMLYAVWSMSAIIALDVAGAVIASAAVLCVSIPKPEAQAVVRARFFDEMKQGFKLLKQHKGLLVLLLVGSAYLLVYMPINALYPLMSMGHFGGTPMHASIAETAFAAGMVLGGFILGLWGGFRKRTATIMASILLMGAALVVSGLLPSGWFVAFAVCCFAMGFSAPFYSAVQTALFQQRIEPQYLGRVFSLTGSVMSLVIPLGLAASGLLADRIGVPMWFLISGALIVGISVLIPVLKPIRQLEETAGKVIVQNDSEKSSEV